MPVRLKIGPLTWTDDVLEELGGDPDFAFGLENERIIDAAEWSAELVLRVAIARGRAG